MTPRIHVSARDYDTPAYHPVQERERIQPMQSSEFEGPGAIVAIVIAAPIGIAIWACLIAAILS